MWMGRCLYPFFNLVVYIWIPKEIRMRRLEERETQRYGEDIDIGGRRYESYQNSWNGHRCMRQQE